MSWGYNTEDKELAVVMYVCVCSRHGANHLQQINSFKEEKGW